MATKLELGNQVETQAREIAELKEKLEIAEATQVAELMVENTGLKDRSDRDEVTIPEQIAEWIQIANNQKVKPKDIFVVDVTESKIIYRFSGSDDTYGIIRLPNGEMIMPTPHVHEAIADADCNLRCRCGETEDLPK